jgi:hypothetical protein
MPQASAGDAWRDALAVRSTVAAMEQQFKSDEVASQAVLAARG